jgi:hypothetical protein
MSPVTHLHAPGTLTVAVLSDLHAYSKCDDKDKKPSFYCISDPIHETPIGDLFKLIIDNRLTADLLLCGGDLAHAAEPAAIREAWSQVHKIGAAM